MVWKPFPFNYLFPNIPLEYTPSQVGVQVDNSEGYKTEAAANQGDERASYDYIVIGSGTAGSIIASRLCQEKENAKILVLEAGDRVNDVMSTIPLFSIMRSNDAKFSYKIKTIPQTGLDGKQVEILAGRLVGGSSAINAGIYTRSTQRELDEWESKYGCQGWNHSTLQEYIDLPLRNDSISTLAPTIESSSLSDQSQGKESKRGPWQYTLRKNHIYPITEKILSVLSEKGVKRNDSDPYTDEIEKGPMGSGCFVLQTSITSDGKKVHAGNAYLSDQVLQTQKNLKICTRAKVTRIDLQKDGEDKVMAKGVFFEDNKGKTFYASAKSKVILSAGVIHTPHLLLLSGIGPKAELERHSIKPILDLPQVGENLKDHLGIPLHFLIPYSNSSISVADGIYALPQLIKNIYDYYGKNGTGTFASPGFMEASAWLNTNEFKFSSTNDSCVRLECKDPHSSICNIELLFSTFWIEWAQTRFKGLDENKSKNPKGIMAIYVILTQPKSKGRITLQSSNPHDSPLIDPNYLQDDQSEDIETVRKGVKFALDVAKNLSQAGLDISPADVPGWDNKLGKYMIDDVKMQDNTPFAMPNQITDQMYDDFIKSRANPIYHGSSSCRMGVAGEAPVDPVTLQVRGTSNLHVFDASAFPNVPSTHPQSLVFAGAEKVAQQLLRKAE